MKSRIILVCLISFCLHSSFAQPTPPAPPPGELLDAWSFENTNWASFFHQSPIAFSNLTLYPDWAGNGLLLDTSNAAFLNYAVVSTEGKTNLSLTNGTLAVWFSPDWNTSDGIGNWGTLLEVGTWNMNLTNATGAWGLYFSPDGENIFFSAQTNGAWTNYLAAPITWDAGDWHQITVTYSLTNTALYLEGAFVTNGPGISVGPSATIISNGFSVGSDGFDTARLQARGMFNDLETYNYILDAETISNNYADDAEIVFPLPSSGGGFSGDYSPPSPGDGGSYTNDGGGGTVGSYNDPAYGSNQFWIEIVPFGTNSNSSTSNYLSLILHNTMGDTAYEILSTTNLQEYNNWNVEETIVGSETTNFTPFVVSMIGRSNLFLRAFNGTLDTDGDGLPDWWETKYSTSNSPLSPTNADTGNTGLPDGYKQDSAGDGYNNLQKYQMGIPPNVFITPPAPTGFQAILNTNGNVVFSWNPASNLPTNGAGAVTGYTLSFFADGVESNIVVSAGTSNYTLSALDNPALDYSFANTASGNSWSLKVNYAHTNSTVASTPNGWYNPSLVVETYFVRGPGGSPTIIFPNIPTNVAAIRVYACGCWYSQTTYTFDVPVSSFTNNIYVCPDSLSKIPFYADLTDTNFPCIIDAGGEAQYSYYTRPIGVDGSIGMLPPDLPYGTYHYWIPFLDGTEHLQENATFQLEAANESGPFDYASPDEVYGGTVYAYPSNYVYACFYQQITSEYWNWFYTDINEVEPFIENAHYRDFMYSSTALNLDGTLQSGVFLDSYDYAYPDGDYWPLPVIPSDTNYSFFAYLFQLEGLTNPPAPLLRNLQYIYDPLGNNDINQYGSQFEMDATANYFGLAYEGAEVAHSYVTDSGTTNLAITAMSPSSPYTMQTNIEQDTFYVATAQPSFTNAGYYFARPYYDTLPSETGFNPTNVSPLILEPLGIGGSPITAWAKESVVNGNANLFAYVEQYLDAAYTTDTNGNITTNSAAIVSEYGDFFATQPGKILLVTRTNMFGQRGTNAVNVISLSLDANHDGIMDTSAFGPDFTSPAKPYIFWANNNYDRLTLDADDGVEYDDSVQIAGDYFTPNNPVPDCNFKDGAGNRAIPCDRDLEDFTRLWISGITTNLLTNLPSGSTITLSWGDVGSPNTNNPTIDLFEAADADGGIGYLTNSTTAAIQTLTSSCPCVGRLGPGQSIQLNGSQFANHWAGNHFIWCGVNYGSGALTLTIADGSGNTLAQTVTYIQIVDIKQMYERWTVGDAPSVAPTNTARLAEDNFPPGLSPIPFQYGMPTDTNTPYILLVHGWNNETWNKDAFAESAFKRLYWQGYHGRFGSFQWPTTYGFTGSFWQAITDPRSYDNGEFQAWQSAQGLMNKLNDLNAEYPGHVYMLAHSMGNVVAGEALRLAAQNGLGQIVNTYVASQAALSAHNYDATVTTPYLLPFTYKYPSGLLSLLGTNNYGPYAPDIYVSRLTNNIAAVGRRINFYNQNDFALAMPRWGFDSILRPDHPVGGYYYYSGSTSDAAPWNHFEFVFTAGDPPPSPTDFDIVSSLHDRYEVMAYAAPSYSTALGATPNVLNISQNLDLTTVWPADTSGHSYADHYWHSAEFRGDYWQEQSYWHTLLYSSTYGFNISNP